MQQQQPNKEQLKAMRNRTAFRIAYLTDRCAALEKIAASIPVSDSDDARTSPIWCDLPADEVKILLNTYTAEYATEVEELKKGIEELTRILGIMDSGLVLGAGGVPPIVRR